MAVACGRDYTLAIDKNGQVFATGNNRKGQLGLGNRDSQTSMTRVPGLSAPVRQVAAGLYHTGIVTEAGDLLMCGSGNHGRLGLGDGKSWTTRTLVPRAMFDGEAVLMVSCGLVHTAVVTEGGGVYTFGSGKYGRLGHGDEGNQLAPRRVPAAAFNGERVVMVAAGSEHTVALSEAGHVFTWGGGGRGQLGHGDQEDQLAPRQVEAGRFGVDAPERVVFVAAGSDKTVAVTARGRLYTWGEEKLRLYEYLLVPRAVSGFGVCNKVVMAACGHAHTLVVTEDGGLWSYGRGWHGQLGLNHLADRFWFRRVSQDSFGGMRVVTAAASFDHSSALTEDGALWTWGNGEEGELGHNNVNSCLKPTKVLGIVFKTRCIQVPPAHILAFTMGAQNRLGSSSPIRMISGEQGLLSMIAQFTNEMLPPAVKKSEGLVRLLGKFNQEYQMPVTVTP